MSSIIIKNGLLIDPSQNLNTLQDILIKNGKIKAIENPGQIQADNSIQTIKADNCIITPGLIDMHVHFREPGHEYKETLKTGAQAAAFGGFTSVLIMPNTKPVLDSAGLIHDIVKKAADLKSVKIWPSAAMTTNQNGGKITEFFDLKEAGAIAVTDDGSWLGDPKIMRRVLEYSKVCGLIPLSHAEDQALSQGGAINEGRVSTRLGLAGIPAASESSAIFRDLKLAELTNCPIHICHVSTKDGLEIIKQAKEKGICVTAETAPHYLSLTEDRVLNYDTNAKINPPLRTKDDQLALKNAIVNGTIDAIATDHAPHSILEKELEFSEASFGIIGLETSLAIMLQLVRDGIINYQKLIELMSINPAKILNLPLGTLKIGSDADITIIDPNLKWSYLPENILSKSHNSPYLNQKFLGKAVLTMVNGSIIYQDKNFNKSLKKH